jgi:hypothetical protein
MGKEGQGKGRETWGRRGRERVRRKGKGCKERSRRGEEGGVGKGQEKGKEGIGKGTGEVGRKGRERGRVGRERGRWRGRRKRKGSGNGTADTRKEQNFDAKDPQNCVRWGKEVVGKDKFKGGWKRGRNNI